MTTYINMKVDGSVETVDEFETRKEALEMLQKYRLYDPHKHYCASSHCTNEWRGKK